MSLDSNTPIQEVIYTLQELAGINIKPEMISTLNSIMTNNNTIKNNLITSLNNKNINNITIDTRWDEIINIIDTILKYKTGDLINVPNVTQDMTTLNLTASSLPILIDDDLNIYLYNGSYIYKYNSEGLLIWNKSMSIIGTWILDSDDGLLFSVNNTLYKISSSSVDGISGFENKGLAINTISSIASVGDNSTYYIGTSVNTVDKLVAGSRVWSTQIYSGPYNVKITYDSSNDCIYANNSNSGVFYKFTSTGTFTSVGSNITASTGGIVCDNLGNLYVGNINTGKLEKYNSEGLLLWSTSLLSVGFKRLFIDKSKGLLYVMTVGLGSNTTGDTFGVISVVDLNGTKLWEFRTANPSDLYILGFDKNGYVYFIDNHNNSTIITKLFTGIKIIS